MPVILAKDSLTFQSLIVQHKSLDDEFLQLLGRPNAELRGRIAVHPISYGDDSIQIVECQALLVPLFRGNQIFFDTVGQMDFRKFNIELQFLVDENK